MNAMNAMRLLPVMALLGCGTPDDDKSDEPMTLAEVGEALRMIAVSAEGENTTGATIELTTDFTIGDAVEKAAEELRDFWQSQVPCTDVSVQGATVTVDYGTLQDNCTYKGKTYAGVHEFTVASTQRLDLEVEHEWFDFTDGDVTVNGTADVTWSANSLTKNVVHNLTWTGREGEVVGDGDRTWGLLEPAQGVWGGLTLEGDRTWHTTAEPDRIWSMAIADVEVRLQDPVPQAGSYTLTNPDGKTIGLNFSRIDDTTIRIEVTGAEDEFLFDIGILGIPKQVDE